MMIEILMVPKKKKKDKPLINSDVNPTTGDLSERFQAIAFWFRSIWHRVASKGIATQAG